MKPHEEQWHHKGQEHVVRTDANYIRVAVYGAGNGGAPHEDVARFIAAAPDMARALEPLARFVAAFDAKPIRGIDDVLYGIHGGSEHEAEIRLSDLRKAVSALRKAGVL